MESESVHQQPEELSGDYEYDMAHERPTGSPAAHRRDQRAGPAPAAGQFELDQDMSYDEAHDF